MPWRWPGIVVWYFQRGAAEKTRANLLADVVKKDRRLEK
jgi:hypothetical protein